MILTTTQKNLLSFERSDFQLAFIPYIVRYKLDLIEIRMHLKEWQQLDIATKENLIGLKCESKEEINNYQKLVIKLIRQLGNTPSQAVMLPFDPFPRELLETAHQFKLQLDRLWPWLNHFQKYLLVKLVRKNDLKKITLLLEDFNLKK